MTLILFFFFDDSIRKLNNLDKKAVKDILQKQNA